MKKTMLIAALAMMNMTAVAKKNPDVKGTVVDEKGEPVGFVNVALLSLPDSAFVQGATSNLDGEFNIITPAEAGVLKFSCIGYETQYINTNSFNGRILLREDSKLMNEVTVKGQMPKTKLTGNSLVTTVEGTVLSQSGSAKEMLGKVPGMMAKGDDLEVLGKGTPIYYINGRRMQNTDELKRLRSEDIKEVEVITNPGAQYDATVTAVVRIKTVRRQGTGFGFDAEAYDNQDLRYGNFMPGTNLNLRYNHKSFEVFGSANYWKWVSVNDSYPNQNSYVKQGDDILNIQQNSSLRHDWKGEGMNYKAGFNWQIAENHSVGAKVQVDQSLSAEMPYEMTTDIVRVMNGDEKNAVRERNVTTEFVKQKSPYDWNGNAYYNGTVGKLGIDLNLDYVAKKTEDDGEIHENTNGRLNNMSTREDASAHMFADKLVLSYPVWKGQLQLGTEMTFVQRKSGYNIVGSNMIPTTQTEVSENNLAGFVEYTCAVPKVGNFSAGLRYEHIDFDYDDLLDASKNISRKSDQLFPSFSWSNQWGNWQASLSYSMKTQRPSYGQLNDAICYINPYSLQQGDSRLKNERKQEVGLNVRYNVFTLFASYERRDDALTQWSYIYNTDGVILIRNINMDVPSHFFSCFVNASPTWGVYSPNWTVGVQKPYLKQTLADPREVSGSRTVTYKNPLLIADFNNAFRFKHSWLIEANLNFMSKGDYNNYRIKSNTWNLSFVVQKCWLKNDALCLRASIGDVLQRAHQKIDMDCGYYTLQQHSYNNQHRLAVSLRYTFNASQSKYKGTGAGKDAVERM